MGCDHAIPLKEARLTCRFHASGFPFESGGRAIPCGTRYHLDCVRVGKPFTSRLRKGAGLQLPPLPDFPGYICEACTVRSQMDSELVSTPAMHGLLLLERMRFIDLVHAWSTNTLKQYQGGLRRIRAFEARFGVQVLRITPLIKPPRSDAIPLMWVQQHYALQPTRWRRKTSTDDINRVTYGTTRSLRSAASMFLKLDFQVAFPGEVYTDPSSRILRAPGVSPTDELSYTLMSKGMSGRLGTESKPAVALLDRQVRHLNDDLEKRFTSGTLLRSAKLEIARAATVNLVSWMGWLRATECFDMRWSDLALTLPGEGAIHGLPPEVGVIQMFLDPQTKTDRTKIADVIVAWTTGSGLSLGKWIKRIMDLLELNVQDLAFNDDFIFMQPGGSQWTSAFFRSTYLWPSLNEQRLAGDPHLRPYDGSPGNTLMEKFWSMHCYRRGGRTQVSKRRPFCVRKATDAEVFEHGRWRRTRQSLTMDKAYLEWLICDRTAITLLCM